MNTNRKVVFLGPSLPLAEAEALCPDALFLPPARCGDLLEVLKIDPSHILLIDGFFEAVPAVWHKEILFVMTKNVVVMGAGSMGALRAAELHPFGMQGIGKITEWYQNGMVTRDDEVAVLHLNSEHHYRPVTEPLVNVRSTLNSDDPQFKALQELPYRERIWTSTIPAVNQKALDAIEALKRLNDLPSPLAGEGEMRSFEGEGIINLITPLPALSRKGRGDLKLSYTLYFKGLHQQVFCRAPTMPAYALSEPQRLLTQTRLFAPCYRELVKLAKLIYACDLLKANVNKIKKSAIGFKSHVRWPTLNHSEWLDAILAAQAPYKASLQSHFKAQHFMPSMPELKRKLTAWQKEEGLETSESVFSWLKLNNYSQEAFEQSLIFETLLDYLVDRGNLFLSIEATALPHTDYFAKAFHLSDSAKYLQKISDAHKVKNSAFLIDHQEDVGLLNALDFYRSADLIAWLTSCA